MHGSNKFGLASLTNLDQLPPKGAILVTPPLKIVTLRLFWSCVRDRRDMRIASGMTPTSNFASASAMTESVNPLPLSVVSFLIRTAARMLPTWRPGRASRSWT